MVAIITLPSTLNPATEVFPTDAFVVDDGTGILKCTAQQIVDAGRPAASEAEALAGTDNFARMTPLRVAQAIEGSDIATDANAAVTIANAAALSAENAALAAENAAAGAFASRGALEAATISDSILAVAVMSNGFKLNFVRDPAGTAITSANFVNFSPAGPVHADHFAENVTPGTTDMSAAFQAASDYLATLGGGDISCPKELGPYAVDTVDLSGGVSIVGGAEFRPIGSTDPMFLSNGVVGSPVTLSANTTPGGNTIPIATTTGFAVDDYVILTDEVSYTSTDASLKNGEILRVLAITPGVSLTVYGSILNTISNGAYTTANGAKVRKVTLAKQSRVEGISIAGDWNLSKILIFMQYVYAPVAQKITVANHGHMAIRMHGCVDPLMTENVINRLRDLLGSGYVGYGLVLSGPCSGGIISENQTDYCRHGVTTLGNNLGFPRGFKVHNNKDYNSTIASFDTHAAGSDYEFSNNLSVNSAGAGITVRAPRGRYVDNKIVRASTGIQVVEENVSDITIEGNELTAIAAVGIQSNVACPNLRILKNNLLRIGNRGIRVFSSATTISNDLVITDNLIDGVAVVTSAVAGIETGGSFTNTRAIIARNTIKAGSGTPSSAIRTVALTTSDIFNNFAQGVFSGTTYDTATNTATSNLSRV